MSNLAIIPARSGSKGLPDKNIRMLRGKPLMAYSIEAAIQSGLFDTVMVSTDSEDYAVIARDLGAEVPFIRSAAASGDTSSSWDVVEEVLSRYENMGRIFESVCLLQPTSPLRNSYDIVKAYEIFRDKRATAVVSMCELEHPIAWCGKLGVDGSLEGFNDMEKSRRRQDYIPDYRPNGAIYIVDTNDFRKDRALYKKGSFAYIMPTDRSVDIDNQVDMDYAEFLLRSFAGR